MPGIRGCQLRRTWSTPAWACDAADLELMQPPQPAHPFLVDALGALEQHMNAPIAVARVVGGQRLDLVDQGGIVRRVCGVVKRRAVDPHQLTGALHRQPAAHQERYCRALLGHAQPLFPSNSRSKSFSSIRSASRRLRRLFSRSNSLRRWASLTDMPP